MSEFIQRIKRTTIAKKVYYVASEERKIVFKNMLKRHYYVIRRQAPGGGFFSNWIWVVAHLCYADKRGYIPVVDQMNYETEYTENKPINGTTNVWEYYFNQPNDASLEDVYESSNYILSDFAIHSDELPYSEATATEFIVNDTKLKHVHDIVSRNIHLNNELQNMLDNNWNKIVHDENEVIIGVHVRRTDKIVPPPGHYAATENDLYIVEIDKILQENPNARIFLCCDDYGTIDMFRSRYGTKVLFNEAYRAKPGSKVGIHLDKAYVRENHKYLLGVEVIMDTYMLAKCDFLIHTHSNVTNAAIIINGGLYKKRVFVG